MSSTRMTGGDTPPMTEPAAAAAGGVSNPGSAASAASEALSGIKKTGDPAAAMGGIITPASLAANPGAAAGAALGAFKDGDANTMALAGSLAAASGAPQPPAVVAMNMLIYTLYSLVGTLLYYPSFLVNIPESTLEETLPKQDLCMRMGFSKRICKKKIKCLIKNCDYLDDPIGYKLDREFKKPCNRKNQKEDLTKKTKMSGGGKRRTKKLYKKAGLDVKTSKKLVKTMKEEYVKNLMKIIFNKKGKEKKKNKKKRKKTTRKYRGGLGGLGGLGGPGMGMGMGMGAGIKDMMSKVPSMPGPTAPWENKKFLDSVTCKNKKTDVMCSLRDGVIKYERPSKKTKWLQEKKLIMMQFGGGDDQNIMQEGGTITEIMDKGKKAAEEATSKAAKYKPELMAQAQEAADKAGINTKKVGKAFENGMDEAKSAAKGLMDKVGDSEELEKKGMDAMANMASKASDIVSGGMEGAKDMMDKMKKAKEGDEEKERRLLIRQYFVSKIKSETLFKLAIILKVLDKLFEKEMVSLNEEKQKKKDAPKMEKELISVVFPWKIGDPNMCLTDKIKCLSSHITETRVNKNQSNSSFYDNCFVCKHCTLRNTATKVWGQVIKGILSGNQTKRLSELVNNTYGILRPYIQFNFMTEVQYYLTTLISLQLVSKNLKIDEITASYNVNGKDFELKDMILGIPALTLVNEKALEPWIEELRKSYVTFHQIGIASEINSLYYESVLKRFFEKEPRDYEGKLEFLKKIAFRNYEVLYVKSLKDQLKNRPSGLFKPLHDNEISPIDMYKFAHFENITTLNNLKNNGSSKDYTELNKHLVEQLEHQYNFLLDIKNFDDDANERKKSHDYAQKEMKRKMDLNAQGEKADIESRGSAAIQNLPDVMIQDEDKVEQQKILINITDMLFIDFDNNEY